MPKIKKNSFSGLSNVHAVKAGALGDILVQMAQTWALHAASSVASMTDSSGGTPGAGATAYTLEATVTAARVTAYQGTAAAPKSEIDLAFGNVRNAIATIAERLKLVAAKVPAVTITNSTGGTDGAGTIAAIDVSYIAVNGAGAVDYATYVALAQQYDTALYELAVATNKLCYATGIQELILPAAYPATTSYDFTLAALGVATGASVTGTTPTALS